MWFSSDSQTLRQVMGLEASQGGWGSVCTRSGKEEDGGEADCFKEGYSAAAAQPQVL